MAINIGTNINYQGHNFLDERQGLAKTERDLKNWSIPVPNGFEAFVNGSWYIYDDTSDSPTTGHFKKRMSDVEELMDITFPLSFKTITPDSIYEIGNSITPHIDWTLEYRNNEVNPVLAKVNNSSSGVNQNFKSFDSLISITTTKTYLVHAEYSLSNRNISCEKNVNFSFSYKKYYGTSEKEELDNSDILAMSYWNWANNWKMESKNFDCTGGKYPYYIIPSDLYDPTTFKVWIGGFRNTDLIVTNQTVINTYNISKNYTIIRLNTKQTGILPIEFK